MLTRLTRVRKAVAVGLVVALAPALLSCYGRFPLTRAVYRLNGEIQAPPVRKGVVESVVMWAFIIVPVYGVSMLADALVFNLVEFWTGKPIRIGAADVPDGGKVVLEPSEDGQEAVLTRWQDGEVVAQIRFVKVSGTTSEVRDEDGNVLGLVMRTPQGSLELTDRHGRMVSMIEADQIAEFAGVFPDGEQGLR